MALVEITFVALVVTQSPDSLSSGGVVSHKDTDISPPHTCPYVSRTHTANMCHTNQTPNTEIYVITKLMHAQAVGETLLFNFSLLPTPVKGDYTFTDEGLSSSRDAITIQTITLAPPQPYPACVHLPLRSHS